MSDARHGDRERKRELRSAYKAREVAAASARMCLQPDELRDLRECLRASIEGLGLPCDRSLERTRRWAEEQGLDVERVVESVGAFGGFCDCEVLLNVTPDRLGWEE